MTVERDCAYCGVALNYENVDTVLNVGTMSERQSVGWCRECGRQMLFDIDLVRRCGGWTPWLNAIAQRGGNRVVKLPAVDAKTAEKIMLMKSRA